MLRQVESYSLRTTICQRDILLGLLIPTFTISWWAIFDVWFEIFGQAMYVFATWVFCLFVCLYIITFSFFKYWIIWWSRPCKPYIFWKHITLATSTALFWPSTTKYQVPCPEYWMIWWFTPCKPYIFWVHITLTTSIAPFWPSTKVYWSSSTKYHPVNNQYRLN